MLQIVTNCRSIKNVRPARDSNGQHCLRVFVHVGNHWHWISSGLPAAETKSKSLGYLSGFCSRGHVICHFFMYPTSGYRDDRKVRILQAFQGIFPAPKNIKTFFPTAQKLKYRIQTQSSKFFPK